MNTEHDNGKWESAAGSNERRWTVQLEGPGPTTLELGLSEGSARITVFHSPSTLNAKRTPRMIWHLAIEVFPVARFRAGLLSLPPDLIFDPDAGSESLDASLGSCLTAVTTGSLFEACSSSNQKPAMDALLTVQRHLRQALKPEAVAAAAIFPAGSSMRWWIYEKSLADPTCRRQEVGRVAQMARICPGILLAARWMELQGFEEGCRQILEQISQGRSLSRILDLTLELWKTPRGEGEREGREQQQRARISRASARIPPGLLMECPAGLVVVEDIPCEPSANLAWFEMVALVDRQPADAFQPEGMAGIRAFVSRHAEELRRSLDRNLEWEFKNLLDFLRAEGRRPNRRTNPQRSLEASRIWHERFGNQVPGFLRGRNGSSQAFQPDQPLLVGPAGPFRLWRCETDFVKLVEKVGELEEESRRMKHCVASYAPQAVAGTSQFFHAEISGEPFTIQLVFEKDTPVLRQASGVLNQRPAPEVLNVIRLWLSDLREALMAKGLGQTPTLRGSFEAG